MARNFPSQITLHFCVKSSITKQILNCILFILAMEQIYHIALYYTVLLIYTVECSVGDAVEGSDLYDYVLAAVWMTNVSPLFEAPLRPATSARRRERQVC